MQNALLSSCSFDRGTIEAMVASDDIEGLLAHADLFFEVRCRTDELIQYLKQKETLHRLLNLIFFTDNKEVAEQAVQLIRACENINDIMSPIVDDLSLLTIPFNALKSLSDQIQADMSGLIGTSHTPIVFPKHFISCILRTCEAFSKVIKSLMWTGRRFCVVLSFLTTKSQYLHIWIQFLADTSMADAFKYIFYDSTSRGQPMVDAVQELATHTDILDLLVENVLHTGSSSEYLSSLSDILCKILVREIPYVSRRLLDQVPKIATYIMHHHFLDNTAQWQIQYLSDIVLCAMSYISVKIVQCYRAAGPDALSTVSSDVLSKRESQFQALLGVEVDNGVLLSVTPESRYTLNSSATNIVLTPLGLSIIDDYEQNIYQIYFHILNAFNNWDAQLELLQNNNGREISVGSLLLFKLVGRILSISADVRNSLVPDEPSKYYTFNNVQISSPYAYSMDNFSRLPESGRYINSGNIKAPLRDIIYCGSIPVHVGVLSIVKKVVALKFHTIAVSCIGKFPSCTVVHFYALQILQSALQYGPNIPEVTLSVATDPSIMLRFKTASYGTYLKRNQRSSNVTYLIQLARYLLRICFGISDQMDLQHKMQCLENGKLSNLPDDIHERPEVTWKHSIYPTSMNAALQLAQELSRNEENNKIVYKKLLEVLNNSTEFVKFSEAFLEKDETVPTVFSDGCKHSYTASNTDSILN